MSNNVGGVALDRPLYECPICLEHNKLPLMFHVRKDAAEKAGENSKNSILVHQTCVGCLTKWVQYGKRRCPQCRVPVKLLAYRVIRSDTDLGELDLCKMPGLDTLFRFEKVQGASRLKILSLNLLKFAPLFFLACLVGALTYLVGISLFEFILLPWLFYPLVGVLAALMPKIIAVIIVVVLFIASLRAFGVLILIIVQFICLGILVLAVLVRPTYVGRKIEAMWNSLSSRLSASLAQQWDLVSGAPAAFQRLSSSPSLSGSDME